MLALAGTTPEEMRAAVEAAGAQPFRAKQILEWVHHRGATSLSAMDNLPKALRERQADAWIARTTSVAHRAESRDGTVKLLIECADGERVEAVLIPEGERRTLCISSQVGCAMACGFCATGTMGLRRNLTAAEIVEQVLWAREELGGADGGAGANPSNVVFMGMGEPLANFDAVQRAIRILNAPWGLELGARRITVSTVGLPDRIRDLATLDLAINLAVSLHAANDTLRNTLVPPNAQIGLLPVMDAADDYFRLTGRRVTFEYVLLEGVNDAPEQAQELVELLDGRGTLVNLLPMNPVPGLPYRYPGADRVAAFTQVLEDAGVTFTLRRRRGDDIAAACGQLRLQAAEEETA
jgi:23S rRNA (adenine2503-C2)-methyltransferase